MKIKSIATLPIRNLLSTYADHDGLLCEDRLCGLCPLSCSLPAFWCICWEGRPIYYEDIEGADKSPDSPN
jgi:hypothetical protein